jgi:hypothetical protein
MITPEHADMWMDWYANRGRPVTWRVDQGKFTLITDIATRHSKTEAMWCYLVYLLSPAFDKGDRITRIEFHPNENRLTDAT